MVKLQLIITILLIFTMSSKGETPNKDRDWEISINKNHTSAKKVLDNTIPGRNLLYLFNSKTDTVNISVYEADYVMLKQINLLVCDIKTDSVYFGIRVPGFNGVYRTSVIMAGIKQKLRRMPDSSKLLIKQENIYNDERKTQKHILNFSFVE